MQNTIIQEQNTPKQLARLAAQRYLYSGAKNILKIQVVLDVFAPILIAVLIVIFPNFDIYGAFISVCVAAIDFFLDAYQSLRKKQAADIQEMFDCDVLGLECQELKMRRRPITEIIMEAARKYKRIEPTYASLKNWYPPIVEQIPLHLARLICQRENCWWDAQLRRRYTRLVGLALIIVSIIVLLLGFIKGMNIGRFFLVVVLPLVPAYIWAVREYQGQTDAANEKDELRKYSEELWAKALKKELTAKQLEKESRYLQDEIYSNRRTNPFILDWFFKHLRQENEEEINKGAEELVKEALQSLGKNTHP